MLKPQEHDQIKKKHLSTLHNFSKLTRLMPNTTSTG